MTKKNISIFDTEKLYAQQKKFYSLEEPHFLRQEIAERLVDRLSDMKQSFDQALLLYPNGDEIDQYLFPHSKVNHLSKLTAFPTTNSDIVHQEYKSEILGLKDHSYDLVISHLCLHHINDLPGFLIQIRRSIKEGGLFIASLFGGETLRDLKQAIFEAEMDCYGGISPRIIPMIDIKDLGGLLQRTGYKDMIVDNDRINISYSHIWTLLSDVKKMGESNVLRERKKGLTSRSFFEKLEDYYMAMMPGDEKKLKCCFDVLFITAWV